MTAPIPFPRASDPGDTGFRDGPFAFVDLEASSLNVGSFPIEVAWVGPSVPAETHLIRPAPGWVEWCPRSERVHGIPLATLLDEGEPAEAVAARVDGLLDGVTCYVSAPSFDGMWLRMLHVAAGMPWRLDVVNSDKAWIRAAWPLTDLVDSIPHGPGAPARLRHALLDRRDHLIGTAHEAAEDLGRPAHRALPDAERMLFTYLEIERACMAEALLHGPPPASPRPST